MGAVRDLRLREQHFPGAENLVFNTASKGFVPLPMPWRKLFRYLSATEWRIATYLMMRASQHGICYPSNEEMLYDLGLTSTKNLEPHLKKLEEKKVITRKTSGPTQFFLVHDPRIPLQYLIDNGKISAEELANINDLLADLKQKPILMETSSAEVITPVAEMPRIETRSNNATPATRPLVKAEVVKMPQQVESWKPVAPPMPPLAATPHHLTNESNQATYYGDEEMAASPLSSKPEATGFVGKPKENPICSHCADTGRINGVEPCPHCAMGKVKKFGDEMKVKKELRMEENRQARERKFRYQESVEV